MALSLYDYKIDYSDHLGAGYSGNVYGVVKRPENEKGCLAWLFPYFYDRIVPVNGCQKTDLCVKILHYRSVGIFSGEATEQFATNKIVREEGLTSVELIKSNSIFSYFKTRVYGRTLQNYTATAECFFNKTDYLLRRRFVDFFQSIITKTHLQFEDVTSINVMYDEIKQRWEIIDGKVTKNGNLNNDQTDQIYTADKISYFVIENLKAIAREGKEYSKQLDTELMDQVNKTFTPQDYEQREVFAKQYLKGKEEWNKSQRWEELQESLAGMGVLACLAAITTIEYQDNTLNFRITI